MKPKRTLRSLRLAVNKTQVEVAGEVGIHPITYSKLETGKTKSPSGVTLQRLAIVFGCSADEIDLSKVAA